MAGISLVLISIGLSLCFGCQKNQPAPVSSPSAPGPSAVQLPSPTPKKPLHAQRIEKTWSSRFSFGTQSILTNHSGIRSYEIDVEYPQIEDQRSRASLKFNRWIKNKIVGYVKQFRQLQQNAEAHDRSRKLPPAHITEGLEIWFRIYYSDEGLISLRLTHSVMALGQMHPISYYETINYDLRRGHPLFEQNVFKKGYTRVFSDFSRKHIKDNYEMDYSTDEWLRSGTSPQKKNFPNWNIVPEGILISFEDYQIAAHSFGQLELIVPYRELKGVLRSTALMSSFLGNDGVSRSSGAWLPKKTRERSTKSHETSRKGLLVRVVSCGFVDHSCSPWWAKPVEQLWDATFMPLGVSSYHVRNVHSDR